MQGKIYKKDKIVLQVEMMLQKVYMYIQAVARIHYYKFTCLSYKYYILFTAAASVVC